MRRAALWLACLGLALPAVAHAQEVIIYRDGFNRQGGLHGSSPEVGAATWSAGSAWTLDGAVARLPEGWQHQAFLPFNPQTGKLYVLALTLDPGEPAIVTWNGFGFAQDTGVLEVPQGTITNFHTTPRSPGPWAILFENGTLNSFLGPGTAGSGSGPSQTAGAPRRLQICLDTRETQWKADWLVSGTLFRSATYATNPAINWVGFGVERNHRTNTVDDFELRAVPPDADADGVSYCRDNCPDAANPTQTDADSDGIGDACEPYIYIIATNDAGVAIGHFRCAQSNAGLLTCDTDPNDPTGQTLLLHPGLVCGGEP